MIAHQVELLRVRLPPVRELATRAIVTAWRQAGGEWQSATFASLEAIGAAFQAKRVEVCPWPADVSLTEIELPPLRASALQKAVGGAIELLALTQPEQLVIGYGARHANGTLPVAWLSTAWLQVTQTALAEAGLRIDALFPPPAFLPQPAPGEASIMVMENWLLLRSGPDSGAMFPLTQEFDNPESRLRTLFPAISEFHMTTQEGEGWHWSLPLARLTGSSEANGLRPVICWALAAAVVWLGGLNLYAWRLQTEGQALKAQMAAQVQAAFPEVPVVLNPLQQARQLRDARMSGNTPQSQADFPTLLRLAAGLLTDSDGQVATVSYQQGQLDIGWREGTALRRTEREALQQQARERQLLVTSDAQGIHVRPGQEADKKTP